MAEVVEVVEAVGEGLAAVGDKYRARGDQRGRSESRGKPPNPVKPRGGSVVNNLVRDAEATSCMFVWSQGHIPKSGSAS